MEGESDSLKPPDTNNMANSPEIGNIPSPGSPEIYRTPGRSTPSPRNDNLNDESFTDGMSEKLKDIQLMANQINSPRQKTIFIENEYWGMIGKAAANLKWNMETLRDRIKGNDMFKSSYISNAKRLRQLPLGSEIGLDNVTVGNPDLITTEEQLEFVKYLHEVIDKLELKPPTKKFSS